MKVVIAGGTGALGRRLADDAAARGDDVVILTRAPRPDLRHRQVAWDGRTVGRWAAELDGAVVVNVAGELVDRRPTGPAIELLRRSRVEPTRTLAAAAAKAAQPLPLWLQMSTLAIYGDAGDAVVDERHPPAGGPPQMAGVARAWERAVQGVNTRRLVVLRTALVLDQGMPALDRLCGLVRAGLGGPMGAGDQWVSWIHVDDFVRAVRFVRDEAALGGVVHLTAPEPVRNRDMMATLRSALGRPWSPPLPRPLVELGALLLRTDPALALTGRRGVPRRLLDAGFTFEHPTFDDAVSDLLGA